LALRFERDRSFGIEFGRRKAGSLQLKGQRHRETSGVGRSNQLFRIGTLLILEAGFERVRSAGQNPGVGRKIDIPGPTRAAPNLFCFAYHVRLLFTGASSAAQNLATSTTAWAKACGASWGRLCPIPPVMVRCSYLPENFFA